MVTPLEVDVFHETHVIAMVTLISGLCYHTPLLPYSIEYTLWWRMELKICF
jgi:hypothetical protein